MNHEGIAIPCPEAGVDRNRCLRGCGACEIAISHHKLFREKLEGAGMEVFPTTVGIENSEMRTIAIVGDHSTAILLHWNCFNGAGTGGEILFRYPEVSNSADPDGMSRTVQQFLTNGA